MRTNPFFGMARQGAKGASAMLRPTALILVIAFSFFGLPKSAEAQQYRSVQPGYYYMGSQNQVQQYYGNRTDQRGISNGGINVGPVGVQGYNNNYSYSYPAQQTQYQNNPYFYYSNGNNCSSQFYYQNQLQSGSGVYYQNGQPYRPPAYQQNFYPARRGY